jgi:hypothetical protein
LEWYFEQADVEAVSVYLDSLFPYYQRKGWYQEAVFVLQQACKLENAPALRLGYWHSWLGEAYYTLASSPKVCATLNSPCNFLDTVFPKLGWRCRLPA